MSIKSYAKPTQKQLRNIVYNANDTLKSNCVLV